MTTPLPRTTSESLGLILGAPGYAVGWQERILIPAPAAGTQWTYKIDGRYHERLISVQQTFNTSAAVASRFPQVTLTDVNGVQVTSTPAGSAIPASNGVIASLFVESPQLATAASGFLYGFLPDILAPSGWTWQSVTPGMDVADAYTAIVLVVQRFPTDTTRIPVTG